MDCSDFDRPVSPRPRKSYNVCERRYATYFNVAPNVTKIMEDSRGFAALDDISTWEYNAHAAIRAEPYSPELLDPAKDGITPAQEVAMAYRASLSEHVSPAENIARRYRAGLRICIEGGEESDLSASTGSSGGGTFSSNLSSSTEAAENFSSETEANENFSRKTEAAESCSSKTEAAGSCSDEAEAIEDFSPSSLDTCDIPSSEEDDDDDDEVVLDIVPFVETDAAKIRHRQSRRDELLLATEEAEAEMEACGATEDDPLVCPRFGCRDTVRNVKALIFHLHMHEVTRDRFKCGECDQEYPTSRKLSSHMCPRQVIMKSAPTTPTREGFHFSSLARIMSALS